MLRKIFRNKRTQGFTIIEILIVLAIAGLILIIIFLAVPALQRNTRNTARKRDAARIAAAIIQFQSDNGKLPGGGAPADQVAWVNTDCPSVAHTAGTLNIFGNSGDLTSWCDGAMVLTPNKFELRNVGMGGSCTGACSGTVNYDALILFEYGVCASSTGVSINVSFGTSSQSALVYPQESASSPWSLNCLQVT